MDTASSRDRSPLRYPASANIGLSPFPASMSEHQQTHPDFAQTYSNPQATFDPSLDQSQYLNHTFTQAAQQPNALILDDYQSMINNNHLSPSSLSNHTSPATEINNFPNFDINDNTLINDIDLLQPQPFTNDAMSQVMNNHTTTPPHLLQNMGRKSSSPSPLASLDTQQGYMRPRNTSESLNPNSAYDLPQQNGDWAHISRGHRRMHSDNLSDVSSHSAQASPYLTTMESFDTAASPMLSGQDPTFSDGLGIAHFSISDPVLQQRRQSYHSPAHSPHISPNLMPTQQPLPHFTPADNFGLNGQYMPDYTDISPSNEMGLADQMSPPIISVDYAPPMKVETSRLPQQTTDEGLSPPPRSRARAKSDSHAGQSRPMVVPAMANRGRSPSLQPSGALSPFAVQSAYSSYSNPSSRDASPAPGYGQNGVPVVNRGRSASAASDRDRMLGLADPKRDHSSTGDNKRQQKHPATFQCHLCTKRFTRAYNLRSHLRTHTDERPFVCTVCDKAFARQHDRKRHEGLHSGEKKFVCRGALKSGGNWGCNRRFARADALGRHFRSEAGRVCIKPLLDEEASEQQQAMWHEQAQAQAQGFAPQMGEMPYFPQALLAQFPALVGLDWNQPQQPGMDDEYGGRSSFDHSSGGEMYDELSENEMGIGSMSVNAPPPQYGMPQPQQQQHQMGYSGPGMGDFNNAFEGR